MKTIIQYVKATSGSISHAALLRLLIVFVLFGGIIFNYFIETKINRSVKKHNEVSAFVVKHEQYKHVIDKTTFTLSQIDKELSNYLLTGNEEQLMLLKSQMDNLQQSVAVVREEASLYVPKYLVNLFVHKLRNRTDFQKEVLKVYNEKGKNAALLLLNSSQDVLTFSDYMHSESELAAVLNRRIDDLSKKLMADEQRTLKTDNKWNLASLVFMLFIAFVVLHQTVRITVLNKHLNEAVQKMQHATRIKDQFMSNITHELRTPLNSILGYTNLLLKKSHQPETEKWIQAVNSSGTLLLDVVNDVLDYSKLESGYLHISNDSFQLDEVLSNLKNIMSNRAEAKGLSLVILKDQSLPASFIGDEKKLKQVLINLTGNAVKFTEKGTVKIEVMLQRQLAQQYWLEFIVTDTGIGIDQQNLKHVFERFYQVENSYSKKYSGTGLGLPIVKQLIDLQGGTITVSSVPGTGTTFKFVLPFEKVEVDEKQTENLAPVRSLLKSVSKRILVVDDHELNRELLELILKEYDCNVVTAANGSEALKLLQHKKFDLVLMDVQMPDLNGIETTLKIRNELVLDLPVIACTAFSQPSEKEMCVQAGMNDYLGKPIDEKALLQLLSKHLNINAAPRTEISIINFKQIHSITGANKELTATMLSRAIALIPEELESLQLSIQQHNFQQVSEQAHTMCSTLGLMGAPTILMDQIKEVQYLARESNPSARQLQELYIDITDTVHKMIAELKQYLAA